jgi:hypothetical protein
MLLLQVAPIFLLCGNTIAYAPHPILFTGGVGASMLNADLNKTTTPSMLCEKQAKDYHLWLYYGDFAPFKATCWLDNIRLRWKNGVLQDAGIKIKLPGDHLQPGDDVNKGFAKDLWSDLLSGVADLGYSKTSPHVGGLHYDWRLSLDQLLADGTYAKMKNTIESAVIKAGGKRAVLVTLSYGGPLIHKFLAQFVDAAWKAQYIERWISLSGVFGGSAELTRMAFYPDAKDFFNIPKFLPYITLMKSREMSNSFSSSFTLRPTFLNDTEALLNVNKNGLLKQYTKHQIGQALADSNLTDAKEVYDASKTAYSFHKLPAPGVAVDCVYGTSDNTISSINFGDDFNHPATGYRYEHGDGVAPDRSLSLCNHWNGADNTMVKVHTFPGIGHGGTLHSPVAVQAFSRILHGLQPPAPPAPPVLENPCATAAPAATQTTTPVATQTTTPVATQTTTPMVLEPATQTPSAVPAKPCAVTPPRIPLANPCATPAQFASVQAAQKKDISMLRHTTIGWPLGVGLFSLLIFAVTTGMVARHIRRDRVQMRTPQFHEAAGDLDPEPDGCPLLADP